MTRDEKIKRIEALERIKKDYRNALDLIEGKDNRYYHGMKDIGLVPKLMYLLGLRKFKDVEYDYSHNEADDELTGIIQIYMERKIKECDDEIDSFFCSDDENRVW